MDASTVMFGLNAFTGLGQTYLARAQASAQNTVNKARVYSSNLMRSANNELASKRGSLARFNQAEGNKRLMEDMGSALEANSVNYRRARDGAIKDDFEQQISFAEQAGQQAAQAAASGLVGGVADVVAGTVALRRARIEQAQGERLKQFDYDAQRQQSNTLRNSLSALDTSTLIDDIDYSVDVFAPALKPSYATPLMTASFQYLQQAPGVTQPSTTKSFNFAPAVSLGLKEGGGLGLKYQGLTSGQ